jgi:hypothetical protein
MLDYSKKPFGAFCNWNWINISFGTFFTRYPICILYTDGVSDLLCNVVLPRNMSANNTEADREPWDMDQLARTTTMEMMDRQAKQATHSWWGALALLWPCMYFSTPQCSTYLLCPAGRRPYLILKHACMLVIVTRKPAAYSILVWYVVTARRLRWTESDVVKLLAHRIPVYLLQNWMAKRPRCTTVHTRTT